MTGACPLCGATTGLCFDRRTRAPVLLNRTYVTAAQARAATTGGLAFTGCLNCGFAWNAAFDPNAIVYDGDYENDQAHSTIFRAHMQDRAARVVRMRPSGQTLDVVEVGAGQGVFLDLVASAGANELRSATGFDPAWRGHPGSGPGRTRLYAELFDALTALRLGLAPNVVVSRHTIEHVQSPRAFLRAIRAALPEGDVRIAVETPCLQWIFDNWAIQDFFYEHCSLFTATTLKLALEDSGFDEVAVERVFGGQYLWAEARASVQAARVETAPAGKPNFADWARQKEAMLARWGAYLEGKGRVYVWGAGAKGITFATLFDPKAERIDAIVDINPNKQGAFAAMTGCPIVGPDAIVGPDPTIIVMNPIYRDEIARLCHSKGLSPTITVFGPEGPP